MKLHELHAIPGANKAVTRKGRGIGSGNGKSERFKFMVIPFRLSIRTMVPAFVSDKIKKVSHDGDAEDDAVDQRCNRREG